MRHAAFTATLVVATLARAEPPPDKSVYHLFNPTPREWMRELSTDRPDTTESPFTVDAGHVQFEMSFVDYTHDRTNSAGETRRILAVAPLLVKFGLTNSIDLQLGIDPYTLDRTTDRATGTTSTTDGFGDTVLRLKINLWGNDGGETALAVMPFVKAPTATGGLGNGDAEGGLIVPFSMALPCEFTLGLMAELDVLRSGDDSRWVADFLHTATISRALIGELGGFIEYAGFLSLSGEESYRAYFDAGLTYGLTPDIQLDAGVRIGLTKAADDVGVFVGISVRY